MAAPGASEMVVVVTGGDPGRPRPPARAARRARRRDRGRLGHRPRPGARPRRRRGDRRLRLGVAARAWRGRPTPGATVERHPAAKDATDLELALDAALALGAGAHPRARGPRRAPRPPPRQRAAPRRARVRLRRRSPPRWAPRASPSCAAPPSSHGPLGDVVSLLAAHGPARGVTTERPALPARPRGPAPRLHPGHQQRARRRAGHRHGRRRRAPRRAARADRPPPPGESPMTPARPLAALAVLLLTLTACGDTDGPDGGGRRRLRRAVGGGGVDRRHGSAAHPRLVRAERRRARRLHRGDRHRGRADPGRRRRHGGQPGHPHERQPAGRRALRDRLHVPVPRARRATSSSPTRPRASTRWTRRCCSTPSTASRPIDYGDVCLNYDKAYFEEHDLAVPDRARRPRRPRLRRPAGGGEPRHLVAGAGVPAGQHRGVRRGRLGGRGGPSCAPTAWRWSTAGRRRTTARSPAAAPARAPARSWCPTRRARRPRCVYADPPVDEPPTGVIDASCYRQVEGAGILAGTDHEAEAGQLIDFLLSERVQADVPLSMFVFPARSGVELPEVFVEHAARPDRASSSCRPTTSTPTGRSGSTGGPTSCSADPAAVGGRPARAAGGVPRRLLRVAGGQHRRRGAAGRRRVGPVRGR